MGWRAQKLAESLLLGKLHAFFIVMFVNLIPNKFPLVGQTLPSFNYLFIYYISLCTFQCLFTLIYLNCSVPIMCTALSYNNDRALFG